MKKLLLLLVACLVGCATPGTVGTKPVMGLITPIVERTDSYITLYPNVISAEDVATYQAAKLSMQSLPANARSAAADSYVAAQIICSTHDTFVKADEKLATEVQKTYLRSSELVLKIYYEAFKAGGRSPPVTETRPTQPNTFPVCSTGSCGLGQG